MVATERNPTTTGSFRFWMAAGVNLKPLTSLGSSRRRTRNSTLATFRDRGRDPSGVDEPSALSSFISSDFGDSEQQPRVGRIVTTYADATVLYNTNDVEMPVPHGSSVHWPDENGVRRALGIDEYRRNTPAGYITMSGPDGKNIVINVDMDADYLIGPEGAHLNISGVSGLATKTSYAMFVLSAIQQRQGSDEWPDDGRASFVILNVKGSDLMRLHEDAPDLSERTRADWKNCGLDARPFSNVTYFYPYSSRGAARVQTSVDADLVMGNIETGRGSDISMMSRVCWSDYTCYLKIWTTPMRRS